MYNQKLRKIYAGCALAMALTIAVTPASAFAAENTEVNTIAPGETGKDAEATSRTGLNPKDTATYSDTDVDVWAFAENTKYSVDVEWGAMTFQYEASWNPETLKMETGSWKVYDSTNDAAAASTQEDINKVTVTNHSNAQVYAKLSYAGLTGTDYSSTTGEFSVKDADTANVKATWDADKKYFTLGTAATDANDAKLTDGSAGTASKGNVYFIPTSAVNAADTIAKWTNIGKITVALQTEAPTA